MTKFVRQMCLIVAMFAFCATGAFADQAKNLIHMVETQLPKLPEQLYGYVVGESNGALILAGGKNAAGLNPKAYVLLKGADAWTSFDLQFKFADAAFTSDGKALYVVGGSIDPKAVYKISWEKKAITETALIPLPEAMPGAGIGVLSNRLYVLGNAKNNFISLPLTGKKPVWKIEPSCPVEGITYPSIVIQRKAITVISAKVNGVPQNIAFTYRPTPSDGALRDAGWRKITPYAKAFEPNYAVASGQSHVVVVKDGKVYLYHMIIDTWCEGQDLSGKIENAQAVAWGKSIVLLPKLFSNNAITGEFRGVQKALSGLDYLILAIYLIIMISIGCYFTKAEKDTADYFLGGRKIPWWAAGVSIYAAGTSAISYMAIPEMGFSTNLINTFPGILFVPLAIIIGGYLIVPLIRRLGYTTAFEFLEQRFHISLRMLGSFKNIIYQLFGRMTVILVLPSLAISAITGFNVFLCIAILGTAVTVYTTLGGFKAVIWTDLAQTFVLLGGGITVFLIMIFQSDGGFAGFISTNIDYEKFRIIEWSLDVHKPIIWIFLITAILGDLTVVQDQTTCQRILATPTVKEARRSFIFLQILVIPGNMLFALLGVAMFSYYRAHAPMLSPTMENIHAIPTFMIQGLPSGVCGLLVAGLLAACMSTLNSSINSVSTLVVTDWYGRFNKKVTEEHKVVVARWVTALAGIGAVGGAMGVAAFQINSFFAFFNTITALLGGGIGGMFMLGMFTTRGNWIGAWAGAVSSVLITIWLTFFSTVYFVWFTPIALLSCGGIGYIVSILTPWANPKSVEGMTIWTPKKGLIEK